VPVSFFFDDMPRTEAAAGHAAVGFGPGGAAGLGLAEEGATFEHDLDDGLSLDKRETLELIRAYYRIADPAVRKRLFELTKALGNLREGAIAPER
jgi:hypothetical protein